MRNLRLEGKYVYLEEVQPKYFPYIIEWRNNPENNKFPTSSLPAIQIFFSFS